MIGGDQTATTHQPTEENGLLEEQAGGNLNELRAQWNFLMI
jgi:hypothetical protein